MWEKVGIIRNQEGLIWAEKLLNACHMMLQETTRNLQNIELYNMLHTAQLMCRFAKRRKESRGTHFREDFPNKSIQDHDVAKAQKDTLVFLDRTKI